MIFKIGNTLLSRYTLVSLLLDKPGLTAWHVHDSVLAQDCQLFITNQKSTAEQVQNLASWLGGTRNPHFTQVQHLHAENSVCVVVTDLDDGMSLSDYLATDAPMSTAAMRTIIGEVATAVTELQDAGFQHRALSSEFVRLGRQRITIADLPVSPLFSYPYLGLSANDIMQSTQATVLRQLGMLLYQMITRMPYIPGQTTSSSTLDASGIDIPDEFRILCTRTLGLRDDGDAMPPVPIVTIDEFLALLGPWKPAPLLTERDMLLPASAVSESIQDASIATIDHEDLVPIPASIMNFDATKSGRQNAHRRANWSDSPLFQRDQVEDLPASDTAMYDEFSISDTMNDSSVRMPAVSQPIADSDTNAGFGMGGFSGGADTTSMASATGVAGVGAGSANGMGAANDARNATPGSMDTRPTVPLDVSAFRSGSAQTQMAVNDAPTATEPAILTRSDGTPAAGGSAAGVADAANATSSNDASSNSASSNGAQPLANLAAGPHSTDANSDAGTQAGSADGAARPSIIPATQPIAILPTVPNRSLANLENRTTQYQEQHYHHRPAPPSFAPHDDAESSTTMTAIGVDDENEHRGGHRAAIITLVIVFLVLLALIVSVATGLLKNSFTNDHSVWPSDLAAAGSSTDETTSESSSTTETTTTSSTPTNTTAYKVTGINYQQNPAGLKGYAFAVTLSQAEPVSKIVISSNAQGGQMSIYADSDFTTPQNGAAVASGTFDASGTTTLTLTKTTTTQKFVIWIDQGNFPTNGQLYINSITVY